MPLNDFLSEMEDVVEADRTRQASAALYNGYSYYLIEAFVTAVY